MRGVINGGVYQVNFSGSCASQFQGKHPAIIVQTLDESEIYYVIPLTTYTKEKWHKLRKFGCCKISSTNSIARIDKIEVLHKSSIPKRYYDNFQLIVPTFEEVSAVYKKALKYITLSFEKSEKEYKAFSAQYLALRNDLETFVSTNSVENTNLSIESSDPTVLNYKLSLVNRLSKADVANIVVQVIPRASIAYNNDAGMVVIGC